jgi:hypothetical protein
MMDRLQADEANRLANPFDPATAESPQAMAERLGVPIYKGSDYGGQEPERLPAGAQSIYSMSGMGKLPGMSAGGPVRYAQGGISNLGGYSDGGQLLRGPGDGVSDNIPAMIGQKQQARLADGEFVVPARIVSELGNGSTEAGARQLYAMMDRVQKARSKSIGKNKVAADSKAHKLMPA